MTELLKLFLEYGTMGLLAATGFWLYLRERKIVADNSTSSREQQVAETQAKVKLTHTLEDLAETIKAVGTNSENGMGVCQGRVEVFIGEVRKLLEEIRIERAKEEGRREVTDRIVVPRGKGED